MRGRHFKKSLLFQSAVTGVFAFYSEAPLSILAFTSSQFFETKSRLPINKNVDLSSDLKSMSSEGLLIWRNG